MRQGYYIKKVIERFPEFYFGILKAPIDFINLESSEQKKNLIQLLILVYSILLGLSPHFLDLLKVSERIFYGQTISFLFIAILYYIIIQKEDSYNKIKDTRYYLFIFFIFVITFLLSMTFSLFLTAFFLIGTTPESNVAVPMNTVISDYTFATFMMLAALMKKDKWTVALFYIFLFAFYFGFSYYLKSLHF
ncbi:Uncharacterised protein [uncultured archaeon]|nr:Uncharacterised protein [uncultured archaeon]